MAYLDVSIFEARLAGLSIRQNDQYPQHLQPQIYRDHFATGMTFAECERQCDVLSPGAAIHYAGWSISAQ